MKKSMVTIVGLLLALMASMASSQPTTGPNKPPPTSFNPLDFPDDGRDRSEPEPGVVYEAPARLSLGYQKDTVLVIYAGLTSTAQAILSADQRHHGLSALYYFDQLDLSMAVFNLQSQTLPKAANHFRQQPRVVWTQPNYFYRTADARQVRSEINWQIHYGLRAIGLDRFLMTHRGGGVTIGLIDSAVQINHPELHGQDIHQQSVFPGHKPDTHGTAIASLLLGNHKIPGIVPSARLISIPAFSDEWHSRGRRSDTEHLAVALNAMLKQPIDVLNLSFSGSKDAIVELLLGEFLSNGVIIVSAAGNGGQSSPPSFPAAYRGVMSITAVDNKNRIYTQANRGDYIDLSAPGVKIMAATKGRSYGLVTGTSFAADYSTGLAALLKSQGMGNREIYRIMTATAQDLGSPGKDPNYGYGLMQAR